MQDYQIRLLREDGAVSLTTEQRHISCDAAITAARKIAHGTRFEVWEADRCLYEELNLASKTPNDSPNPAP